MRNETRLKRLKELEYMLLNHKKIFKEYGIVFNLSNWATKACDFAQATFFNSKEDEIVKKSTMCGSAACALGSAALYEPFMKQGLRMKACSVTTETNEGGDLPEIKYEAGFTPDYKGHDGETAGEVFFGLTYDETDNLFMPDAYDCEEPTAKDVAVRVRALINKYQKEAA